MWLAMLVVIVKETDLVRMGMLMVFNIIFVHYDVGKEVILAPHVGIAVAHLGAIEDTEVGVLHRILY